MIRYIPFYIFLISIFFSQSAIAAYVSIKGKINQASSGEISFTMVENELTGEKIKYVATLEGANEFFVGLEIKQPQIVTVQYGTASFELFLAPTDQSLGVEFDAANPLRTLVFHGENAINNNYLTLFRLNYGLLGQQQKYEAGGFTSFYDKDVISKAQSYSAEDYFRVLKDNFQTQQRNLHNQPKLNRALYQYLDKEIQWLYETNKMAYFLFNKDRLSPNDLRRYWVRFALLQTVDINDESALQYEPFQNLLESFIHYLYLETPVKGGELSTEYYRFIQRNLTGRCRYFMLGKLMLDNYREANNSSIAQRMFKNYKAYNPYPKYTQTLETVFGSALEYVALESVPNFTVKSLSGQNISLIDYQGQVVYISFWASWCGPCLKGFRASYGIRQQLQQQGVVLLNINLDKTEDLWLNTVKREQIQGTNVYGVDLAAIQEKFKISALPFYLCVDKQGNRNFLSSSDLNYAYKDLMEMIK